MPMNQLPMYRDCHYISINDNCRVIHDYCLSIPCSTGISDTELDKVILTIKSFFKLVPDFKRIMDVFLSFLAIVILSPVLFLIVLILKFTGEGEVLFYNIGLVTK